MNDITLKRVQQVYDDLAAATRQYAAACASADLSISHLSDSVYVRLFSDDDARRTRIELRKKLESWLIRQASKEFAPAGARLDIDEREVITEEESHNSPELVLDASGLWTKLDQQYGGDRGSATAYAQAAKRLERELVSERRPPERRGPSTVFQLYLYTEAKYGGGRELSYHAHESLTETLRALSAFGAWAGDGAMRFGVDRIAHDLWKDRTVRSRQRFQLTRGVELVLFNSKAEIVMSHEIAEKLQVFIQVHCREPAEA
jgi:uncharacterized protein YukE